MDNKSHIFVPRYIDAQYSIDIFSQATRNETKNVIFVREYSFTTRTHTSASARTTNFIFCSD